MSRVYALLVAVAVALTIRAIIPQVSKNEALASVCALSPRSCESKCSQKLKGIGAGDLVSFMCKPDPFKRAR